MLADGSQGGPGLARALGDFLEVLFTSTPPRHVSRPSNQATRDGMRRQGEEEDDGEGEARGLTHLDVRAGLSQDVMKIIADGKEHEILSHEFGHALGSA